MLKECLCLSFIVLMLLSCKTGKKAASSLQSTSVSGGTDNEFGYPWEVEPRPKYSLAYCPIVGLSIQCGNKSCDPLLGETANNCPMDCSKALVQTWNAGVQCTDVKEVLTPSSVADVQAIIKRAAAEKRKVRVVGGKYSNTDLICSKDITISSENLKEIGDISPFEGNETIRVGAGLSNFEVMKYLASKGKALLGFPTPIIRPATVGGSIGTSSHASSALHPAIMSDVIASLEIVGADGNMKVYSPGTVSKEEWQAANANLGLLGVVTHVRLKVREEKTLSMKAVVKDETEIFAAKDPVDLVAGCDYGQFWWNPIARKALWVCGKQTEEKPDMTADNALNEVILKKLKSMTEGVGAIVSGVFELAACSNKTRCTVRDTAGKSTVTDPNIFSVLDKKGKRQLVAQASGQSHRMITSDFDNFNRVRSRFLEVSVPPRHRKAVLQAIRDYYDSSEECEIFSVYNIRFTPIHATSLIGNSAVDKDFPEGEVSMFVEINGYYPKGMATREFIKFDTYNNLLVKMLIERFGARPHWGKGEHWYHKYAFEKAVRADGLRAFRGVVKAVDPMGIFANDFAVDAGLVER